MQDETTQEQELSSGRFAGLKKWLGILSISRIIRWAIYLFLAGWIYQNWHDDLPENELR